MLIVCTVTASVHAEACPYNLHMQVGTAFWPSALYD